MLRDGETIDDYDFSETYLNPYARGVDWEAIMSGETSASDEEFLDDDDDEETAGNGFLETAVHSTRRPAETTESSESAETEATTVPEDPEEETAESTSKKKKKTKTETAVLKHRDLKRSHGKNPKIPKLPVFPKRRKLPKTVRLPPG